jgi:ribosomal-protein-alanine N-acetyltransferase
MSDGGLAIAQGAAILPARIETTRLVLRAPRTGDVTGLRRALQKNAAHLLPWTAAALAHRDPASLGSVSRSILRDRGEWRARRQFAFLIMPRSDERSIIGRITLGGVLWGVLQSAHMGYWIDSDEQGRGLMTEAVHALTSSALSIGKLHRVQAAVMPRNTASKRVLEKVGYRREGFAERYLCIAGKWEDHLLFATTAEEWSGGGLLAQRADARAR